MRKKVLLAIAFVAIAMVSGGTISLLGMHQGSVEAKSASQPATVETIQTENAKIVEEESKVAVQTEKMTFSCGVSGCTETEVHQHGLCGIDGCTQIGEHSHDICGIAGCTETGTHQHNGEYCYPHSADDGHAYHTCGVSGCTETGEHSHGGGNESNGNNGDSGGHHHSGHGGGHH